MINRKWFDGEKAGLFLLLVFAAAIRIFFLFKYDNMPGFAENCVVVALRIIENPSLPANFEGTLSLLYVYAMAFFMYFWRDPIWAPKVFTFLFGVFTVLPYYGTLKVLFNRRIAFLSSFVLVFYMMHIIQSSLTTSSAVFYFFLFSAFYYFFSFRCGKKQISALWLSALLFNVAALLRFEGWLFIPVFFFLLWPRGKAQAVLFLSLAMISPCLHMTLSRIIQGDFFLVFTSPAIICRMTVAFGGEGYDLRLWSWLHVLWRTLEPSLVIGGLLGMVLAFLLRRGFELAIFFLALFSGLTVSTFLARLVINDRYSICLGLLLIPYAWFFVDRFLAFVGDRRKRFFVWFLILPAMTFFHMAQNPASALPNQLCLIPPEIKEAGLWLKKNVRQGESLVIDADPNDLYPVNLLLRSGVSPAKCLVLYTPRPWVAKAIFESKDEFERHLLTARPQYVTLASNGYLQKILSFDLGKKKQILGKASLEVVFEQEVKGQDMKYLIYRVSY